MNIISMYSSKHLWSWNWLTDAKWKLMINCSKMRCKHFWVHRRWRSWWWHICCSLHYVILAELWHSKNRRIISMQFINDPRFKDYALSLQTHSRLMCTNQSIWSSFFFLRYHTSTRIVPLRAILSFNLIAEAHDLNPSEAIASPKTPIAYFVVIA